MASWFDAKFYMILAFLTLIALGIPLVFYFMKKKSGYKPIPQSFCMPQYDLVNPSLSYDEFASERMRQAPTYSHGDHVYVDPEFGTPEPFYARFYAR